MKKIALLLTLLIIISGCATQQALIKSTTSGYPEGIFRNSNLDEVKSKIMDGCVRGGLMVSEVTSNQVVCEKTMEGRDAILAKMALGNSYSTRPVRKTRFIIYKQYNEIKVTAQQWFQLQTAFGQVKKQELMSNNHRNELQQFLFSLGAE